MDGNGSQTAPDQSGTYYVGEPWYPNYPDYPRQPGTIYMEPPQPQWVIQPQEYFKNVPTNRKYDKDEYPVVEIQLMGVSDPLIITNVTKVRISEHQTTIDYSINGRDCQMEIPTDSYLYLHKIN